MSHKLLALTSIFSLFAGISFVSAHPGHAHRHSDESSPVPAARIWSNPTAPGTVRGTFVAAVRDSIQIRRPDDSLVEIPFEQLIPADQAWIESRLQQIRQLNLDSRPQEPGEPRQLALQTPSRPTGKGSMTTPDIARAFEPFAKTKAVAVRWDAQFFYVESNGLPAHRMMVGITNWQQQVPLPQPYRGDNAWQIPLRPVPAKQPMSTRNAFLRGAIALAVNGVPIFNPLNNRGDDALLAGELDEFGGHCGRADDYHYHIAPTHLQKVVGKDKPIAYALDGYPIFGYEEPDGSKVVKLDALNGHHDKDGHYHYHATKTYPYLNGGFHGEVTERGGQVDPQPRAEPLRPDGRPLRGARITDFTSNNEEQRHMLKYELQGRTHSIRYRKLTDGSYEFIYIDDRGQERAETYHRRERPEPPPQGKSGRPAPPPKRS